MGHHYNLLPDKTIHTCVKQLLAGWNDEDKLESLCKLFSVVGARVDRGPAVAWIDVYFNFLKEIEADKSNGLQQRIRFVILETRELRKNKWIPRQRQQSQVVQIPSSRNPIAQGMASQGMRAGQGGNAMPRMGGSSGRMGSRDQGPMRGSGFGGRDDSRSFMGSDRGDRGRMGGHPFGGSGNADMPVQIARRAAPEQGDRGRKPSAEKAKVSAAEQERKIKGLLEQYYDLEDVKEAMEDVKELGSREKHDFMVQDLIDRALEGKATKRHLANLFMTTAYSKSLVDAESLCKGLQPAVEGLED